MQNKKFGNILSGKGYYIALILCAVAIGISGYLYYQNANEPANGDVPAIATDPTTGATLPNGNTPTDPTSPTTPQKRLTATVSPVTGEKVMEYAMDCLTYNPTTRDWRTHDGVDIAADAGTAVCAAADGTVYTVYDDDTMGVTVVIRHEDGYATSYACLAEEVAVKPGDTVTMGQAIGAVGQTALMESAIGHHLHFSVTLNDESISPADFLSIGK
ncbi:MAG: M23 family metallopeptidase [Ruminococcaceae bacterium]|nr:M23 family metallopeptidase [Oscillospiraceae bacterium]